MLSKQHFHSIEHLMKKQFWRRRTVRTVIYLTALQVQYLLILWAIRHLAELSLWQFPSISSEHFIFQRLSGPGQRVAIIKSKQKQQGERERDGWQPQTYWIGTTTIVTSLLIRKPALVQDFNAEYLLLIVGSNFVKKNRYWKIKQWLITL